MPAPLTAKHRRGTTPVVRVEVPVFWTIDEAAQALALHYADRPVMIGKPAIQAGINGAATDRLLEKAGMRPDPGLVEEYRQVLSRHRQRFVRYVRTAEGEFRSAVWLKLPLEQATHVRTDVASFFDVEQAARALALVHDEVEIARTERSDGSVALQAPRRRTGRLTCERGLHRAARLRVLERRSVGRDEAAGDRVEFFRRLLLDTGMFPESVE